MNDLLAHLAAPPRMRGRILDVRGRAANLPQDWAWWADRVILRFFTDDPYEADRVGPDRFLANHLLEEPEVLLYLSWGEAELDAADMGWDAYLARAWSTAVCTAADHDEACTRGRYTAEKFALGRPDAAATWREPLDALIQWRTAGWTEYSLGIFVDIVEAEYGLIGFSPEPLEFDEPGEGDPECAACNGRPVFVPHSPAAVLRALCGEHEAEWDERSADRVPVHEGEAKRALAVAMLAVGEPRAPAGFWAGLARIDPDVGSSQFAFLERVAGWCREHGVDLDDVASAEDAMTVAMPRGLEPIARGMGVEAALEAAEFRRAMLPSACWAPDMDSMNLLQRAGRHDEAAAMRDHLAIHGRELPFVYHAIGETYELDGDVEQAIRWHRKALARTVALDLEQLVDLPLNSLRGMPAGAKDEATQEWLDEVQATIEAKGLTALRPERNEPCLCGSGRKWKQCCG